MKQKSMTIRKQTPAQVAAQAAMQAIRAQVRDLCCRVGVPVVALPLYYCFALELYGLVRREITGESAAMEADVYRAKWVARGLQTAVLDEIRSKVFSIPAPTP